MKKEIIIPVSVVVLAIAFLDPFMVLMTPSVVYTLLALLFIMSLIYSLFIWKEQPHDEREYLHRAFAARIAYLAGVLVLVASIIYQVLVLHSVDFLLVLTLGVMTVAKYLGLLYANEKN